MRRSTSNLFYSWSNHHVYIGDSKNSIIGYTTDYTSLNQNIFLKHNIGSSDTVESTEVCYLLNSNQYCLKGGDGDASYQLNKEILSESFGYQACQENGDDFDCSNDDFLAYVGGSGMVYLIEGDKTCEVYSNGSARCYEF